MEKTTKKDRFLEVALRLIHKKGFKATTLRDIAHELNFEVANVYNYIESKQDLLEAYLFDIQNEFHDSIDLILESSYTPEEKLRLVISSYIQVTARRPYEQALLVNEWRNLKEPRLREFTDRRKAYENKLKTIIQAGLRQGQFRTVDPEFTTQTILATVRWLYLGFIDKGVKMNPIETEKKITEFIFSGIIEKMDN